MGGIKRKKERLITPNEAAERLSVSPLTIKKWLRARKIKGVKLMSVWRIREEEIEKLINKGEESK